MDAQTQQAAAPLEGQTILLTGATDGLGSHLARQVAASGARLLLHGRDPARVAAAVAVARAAGNDRVLGYVADYASLAEVRRLASQIRSDHGRLDVLINNAGVMLGDRQISVDGYELTFAVNYLAPFVLTRELLPLLRVSAPSRIVNVASIGQAPVHFDDVMFERGYETRRAYAQSKLALIMFTFDLADEMDGTGVTSCCLHPATLMPTKLVHEHFGRIVKSLEDGSTAVLRLAAAADGLAIHGRYFDQQREARAHDQAYDLIARQRLRHLTEALVTAV